MKYIRKKTCNLFSTKRFYLFCIDKREHKANGLIINPYPYSFLFYAITSMPLHLIVHIKQSKFVFIINPNP